MSAFRKCLARCRAFVSDRRGNIAMIWALALVPLMLAIGGGLDLARAMIVKAEMTDALDAAALAVGSSTNLSTAQIQTLAQQYFSANYVEDPSFGTPAAVSVNTSGQQQIQLSTSAAMPTVLLRLAGIPTLSVAASSTVVWGQLKLWVALVLDNTGSMTETDSTGTSKISALKTASQQLLTMLQNASTTPGDVQVSIVPFAKDVNIGSSNSNQSWISWSLYGSCDISGIVDQTTCTTTHGSWTYNWWNGWSCNIQGYWSQSSCQNAVGTWTSYNKSNWNGCITDRGPVNGPTPQNTTQANDVLNTAPTSSDPTSYFFPESYNSCPVSMMTLGYSWSNLSSKINSMVANGSTNQTIGLALGWQTLSQGSPFSPPALPDGTQRFIILLSDGLNTQDRWWGNGSNQSSQVDGRMALACANAKADGIVIYTIFVDLNGTQGSSTVLQNCATDADHYFDLTTSGQIITAFNTIGQQITNLRVSQ